MQLDLWESHEKSLFGVPHVIDNGYGCIAFCDRAQTPTLDDTASQQAPNLENLPISSSSITTEIRYKDKIIPYHIKISPMKRLIQGVHQFQTHYFSEHRDLFEILSQGQHPRVLFITCSDSRIDPNLLTQAEPGEMFIIRNAGNIIPPYNATNGGEGATVEYAIHALGIQEIIVCGHSHCGAMKGLLKIGKLAEEMPAVYEWLKHAEATRRIMKEHYHGYEGEDLLEATVKENVLTQVENLRTYPVVYSRLKSGELNLHAWFYEIETGEVLEYNTALQRYVPPQTQFSRSAWITPEQQERIYKGSNNSNKD